MTLFVDLDLPPGALLPQPPAPLGPGLEALGAVWFDFHPDRAIREDGRIVALGSRTGDVRAAAVEANEGHATLAEIGGTHVLLTEARRNSGFVTADAAMARVSVIAVLAGSNGAGRTIAGIEAPGSGRSFHLSEDDGALIFGERRADTDARVALAPRGDAPLLALGALGPDTVTVAVDDGAPVSAALDPAWIAEHLRLLIACRRAASGLWNTLGELKLADLIFLPGADIFAPEMADLRAALLTHARTDT